MVGIGTAAANQVINQTQQTSGSARGPASGLSKPSGADVEKFKKAMQSPPGQQTSQTQNQSSLQATQNSNLDPSRSIGEKILHHIGKAVAAGSRQYRKEVGSEQNLSTKNAISPSEMFKIEIQTQKVVVTDSVATSATKKVDQIGEGLLRNQ